MTTFQPLRTAMALPAPAPDTSPTPPKWKAFEKRLEAIEERQEAELALRRQAAEQREGTADADRVGSISGAQFWERVTQLDESDKSTKKDIENLQNDIKNLQNDF